MNTSQAFENYINHLTACGRSPETLTAYRQRLGRFLEMFKRRAGDVDVTGERHNPHAVRHLVGTVAVQTLGIRDAQLLLGHEDVNSTLIYAGVDDERVKLITDSLSIF